MAHSRTRAAPNHPPAPVTNGTSDVPCAVPRGVTSNTEAIVAWMSTLVVKASHVPPPATPGQDASSGMCPSGSYCMTPGLPQMSFSPR